MLNKYEALLGERLELAFGTCFPIKLAKLTYIVVRENSE